MESKKQLIVWVLNVLNNESDKDHPLTQTKIASILSECYPCDRKTVCRNIRFLQDMGYPIRKTPKGFFMDRKVISVDEVLFVREAILHAPGKDMPEKQELAERVATILSAAYRR